MDLNAKARTLRDLHSAPGILQLVNVWDAITAKVVADLPETKALATAGHSIAASYGYPDGEVPLDLMFAMVARITAVTDLPVSVDLDDGRENPSETVRGAIEAGGVGANVEDRLKPLAESVDVVRDVMAAAAGAGVPDFVLNARTDAFLRGGDRSTAESVKDAVERGRAYLDAGATCIFVPGNLKESVIADVVGGIGNGKVSVIGFPNVPAPARLAELGVARISYGPLTQRWSLGALADFAGTVYAGGATPSGIRALN